MEREGLTFRIDDLSGPETRGLIARHLRGMHESSPPVTVHAFDEDPFSISVWRDL
ncbi:MAG: hypothetical protein ABSE49_19040 [Polyangiaceae bacterium]|jgi:putative acetyltransferase